MTNKILTSWHPAIRWLLLPIACLLFPMILSLIVSIFLPSEGDYIWGGYQVTGFLSCMYECLRSFLFGSGFIIPIIYLAPKYTKIILNIVRVIMLIIFTGILIWFFNQEHNFGLWDSIKYIGYSLCTILGLFVDKFCEINIED
ncbi:hypothetical protein BKG94_06285 [Rodentibacter ratti]|uniref:hypothetical protein n=1 Tax=Rodentibacter ratti TaxID=1906745 RepID=UPI000985ED76|nr:hypothetical protein [Rodentibacter ratti]OOF88747.1 hypothetical protein BKG94_06285 [Rodentibacter ratti]